MPAPEPAGPRWVRQGLGDVPRRQRLGGSAKTITGYFLGNFISKPLTVGECTPAQQAAGTYGLIDANSPFDNYFVRLSE